MEQNNNIDNILNECLERVVFHGENPEDVLKSYPDQAAELAPLLKTAVMVKQAAAVTPRQEFKARARYEFHRALAAEKTEKRGSLLGFMPRWATALSVALAALLATGGTVAAATSSMPDSPLYPVKLATEQARVTVTFSSEAKAELFAELTDKRVTEIVYMANKGDSVQVVTLTRKLDSQMDQLATMTEEASGHSRAAVAVSAPQAVPPNVAPAAQPSMGGGTTGGAALAGTPSLGAGPKEATPVSPQIAPFAASPQPRFGITSAERGATTAAGAEDSSKTSAKALREPNLRKILAANAIKHPAELRAALEKVPEPARQEILRSIAVAAANYEKAIRSLDQP